MLKQQNEKRVGFNTPQANRMKAEQSQKAELAGRCLRIKIYLSGA